MIENPMVLGNIEEKKQLICDHCGNVIEDEYYEYDEIFCEECFDKIVKEECRKVL